MPLRRTFLSCSLCLFFCGVYLVQMGNRCKKGGGWFAALSAVIITNGYACV